MSNSINSNMLSQLLSSLGSGGGSGPQRTAASDGGGQNPLLGATKFNQGSGSCPCGGPPGSCNACA